MFDPEKDSILSGMNVSDAKGNDDPILGNSSQDQFALARELQAKASEFGFDWPTIEPVFDKLHEEIDELKVEVADLKSELSQGCGDVQETERLKSRIEKEFGDLLFVCVNLSRFLELDCHAALSTTNEKFIKRFHYIEQKLQEQGADVKSTSLEKLDALWDEAKTEL